MSAPNPSLSHIAVIPDGNRRWAKQHGKTTEEAHQIAYHNLKKVADLCFVRGIKYVTGYVFSTENWNRTEAEVGYLMNLAGWAIKEEAQEFHEKGIKIRIIGSRDRIDPELAKGLDGVVELTKGNTNGTISICFNYGGRRDIVEAVNRAIGSGIKSIDEETFPNWLSTAGIPDPNLIIRTSGEHRLSNFLIWESAYSELYFSDVLWPDFGEAELDTAIADYTDRARRFGK